MAIIRLDALRALANCIQENIPELKTKVCPSQASANKRMTFPHLAIQAIGFKYFPDQALGVHEPSATKLVVNVGRHEGIVQLRLGSAARQRRYDYEQRILDLFLSEPLHPGVLLTPVTSCTKLGDWMASWELEEDEWNDEMVFDNAWFSIMTITGQLPALVTRCGVHTIEQLRMGLTEDLTTEFDASSFDTSPDIERVLINEDGSLDAVP
jgi:hypothetical protein